MAFEITSVADLFTYTFALANESAGGCWTFRFGSIATVVPGLS